MQTSDKHEKIMASPENHFGDDASIDDKTNEKILEFPRQNLAQKSNSQWAIKFAKNDELQALFGKKHTRAWTKKSLSVKK